MTQLIGLTRRLHVKGLLPLLLSVAVSQAYAVDHGANGLADNQIRSETGPGNVNVTLTATGGHGADGTLSGGNGGAANAVLDLTAQWQAGATISAYGGNGGKLVPDNPDGVFGFGGDATASGVLRGAGALGSALAQGGSYSNPAANLPNAGNANSSLTAWTTGAQAVDLTSTAYAGLGGGSSTASLYVDSGVTAPTAGTASVSGNVKAIGNDAYSPGGSIATLSLYGSGNLTGSSLAQTGASYEDPFINITPGAAAQSTVVGVTTGKHDVSLSSTAKGNYGPYGGIGATATVSGKSGSGKVVVSADATTPYQSFGSGFANATATARSTAQGGSSYAHATAAASNASASAEAYSVGTGGSTAIATGLGDDFSSGHGSATAKSTASNGGSGLLVASASSDSSGTAIGRAAYGGLSVALPALDGSVQSQVVVTAGGAAGIGAGMQAASGGNIGYSVQEGQHTWQQSAAAGHLWITFLQSAAGSVPFCSLELYISNNGQSLYDTSFGSVAEANLFFNNHTLDLGPLGAGLQNLVIHSDLSGATAGYAFNYILAVPEPLEWLLMLSGLALVMVAARRKRVA
jgi:hypothetical protein